MEQQLRRQHHNRCLISSKLLSLHTPVTFLHHHYHQYHNHSSQLLSLHTPVTFLHHHYHQHHDRLLSLHTTVTTPPSLPLEVVPTEITTEGYHPAEYMDENNLQYQSLIDNIQVPPLNPIPISPLSPSPSSLLKLPCQLSSEHSLESNQEKPSTNQVF